MKIHVVYRFPLSGLRRDLEDEYERLKIEEDSEEDSEAKKLEILEKMSESQDSSYRVTVRQCSYMDRSHYSILVREGSKWVKDNLGVDITEEPPEGDMDFAYLRTLVYYRAEVFCCVPREHISLGYVYFWEKGSAPYGKVPEKWEREPMPESWYTIQGIMDDMPADLLEALVNASRRLNAGSLPSVPDFIKGSSIQIKEI